jgi:hypothetical protein
MNEELLAVLEALYAIEGESLVRGDFDGWVTPNEIAARLADTGSPTSGLNWVRARLDQLWIARKILLIPKEEAEPAHFVDVELIGLDRHEEVDGRLRLEADDVRGKDSSNYQQVAVHDVKTPIKVRSRVAEIGRLLSQNYLRFGMAPATGVIRYERRPQQRPRRTLLISEVRDQWRAQIEAGELIVQTVEQTRRYRLRANVPKAELVQAMEAVMQALAERLGPGRDRLGSFQVTSVAATIAGLYSDAYRAEYDAHVITAGVGSGKSFAFQLGALIHTSACALRGLSGLRVLLIYPRVVLAANQFQELRELVRRVAEILGISLRDPLLDAGSQLSQQLGIGEVPGALSQAMKQAYGSGNYPIIISNLDTLANRLTHPEAARGLVEHLDLIVCDELHLLAGLYGSHSRMLLKRLGLLRAMWQLRARHATELFEVLLNRRSQIRHAYFVGASATIAAPKQHAGRLFELDQDRVLAVDVSDIEDTGWVHHFFIRQRPEVSTMSALVNATAALIHNRRDGVFREYYQERVDQGTPQPIGMDQLSNPIQSGPVVTVVPRSPELIHKTIGFCDSLDGVGRWADLVADNEGTKAKGVVFPNPGNPDVYPYFTRFQEPLWRQVHQRSFAAKPDKWIGVLRQHYGTLCRQCKKGQQCSIPRVPTGLSAAGQTEVDALWDFSPTNGNSYLARLGVSPEHLGAEWFTPVRDAGQAETLSNLDGCSFFQTGLCWWWSMDHAGSNAPKPASEQTPLNGVRMAGPRSDRRHHFVNGVRLSRFTSETKGDLLALNTINDIFRGPAPLVLRDMNYGQAQQENSVFVIGSPRLEVGVDLNRVRDGITYRAMRDPASLQQKVGRVGREPGSDSVLVHLVTQNTRDQYYFRNPQIALDPQYLQALPLHEDNRIVARHHLFMAIVDFLSIQGAEPGNAAIANRGDRIALVNDHSQTPAFSAWDSKVQAVHDFLFGQHSNAVQNRENLQNYLRLLGATETDLTQPQAASLLTAANAPMSQPIGVIDLFQHEFGPNFFLTELPRPGATPVTLAWAVTEPMVPPQAAPANLPRHREFLRQIGAQQAQGGGKPVQYRSYLRDLLGQPLFRRGLPAAGLPGDHPFVWTPNFFQAVGVETVRFVEVGGQQSRERAYESVSLSLALLTPGTVTYRYSSTPLKVPVGAHHAVASPNTIGSLLQMVVLQTDTSEYFEAAASCPDIESDDLPPDFVGYGPVKVFTPRQLALIKSDSEPRVLPRDMGEGLLVDGDSRPVPQGQAFAGSFTLPQPPRSFSLRWYRLVSSVGRTAVESRFQRLLREYANNPPAFPWPPVFSMFSTMDFDHQLEVTDYVWGLDRQFTSRRADAARLVYWRQTEDQTPVPMSLGHRYTAPGLVFTVDISPESAVSTFLSELLGRPESIVYQSLLPQVLQRFIAEYGRISGGGWFATPRPSIFVIRNLRTIVLFHLLERWHEPGSESAPQTPPAFTLEQLAGCFDPNHPNWISRERFSEICGVIAPIHEPPSVPDHRQTLLSTRANFEAATAQVGSLNADFFRRVALDLLLNSLGLSLHEAALRLSGAERENVGYFYRQREATAELFLFDNDAFGNGTTELVRDHFFVPNAQRALATRLRMLGQQPDPLPTKDFARCFEEELHECGSSQAAHLAFHNLTPESTCWQGLNAEFQGERQRAGSLYDFLRFELGLDSFDRLGIVHACPEYIVQLSAVRGQPLVGSAQFPVFQALESAFGFCLSGCVGCLVAPETNLHGSLEARETVNKVLLDAFYRRTICEANTSAAVVCYPANGPSRTCECAQWTAVLATALAQDASPLSIELMLPAGSAGEQVVSLVSPLVTRGANPVVFRTSWDPVGVPEPRVRVRMDY